jgi:1,4-alpha-glucan branching enzyme
VSAAANGRGELAIVLHSHMPYVEGFGTWPFGEEWLFEAMATAYLPLLALGERWAEEGRGDVLTVGITPVLADQLALPSVGERFERFVDHTRPECQRIDAEGLEREGDSKAAEAARMSRLDYERALQHFERLGGDLLGAFRRLRDAGALELWTSTATHAVLPLLATEAGVRLQVVTGVESHGRRFGPWSRGFWLPECAFTPGLDEPLARAGVEAFCVDQTGGDPLDQLEPVATEAGPVAVPIDWGTITLVWDERGYPADALYRDYHAAKANGTRPYANGGSAYRPEPAKARAAEHGRHFVARVLERLDSYHRARGRPGLVVCALDTELLGHWWHEGPFWLGAVVQEAERAGLTLTSLPGALERHEPLPRELTESSWGVGKNLGTWDSQAVAELVWLTRRSELAVCSAASALDGREAHAQIVERAARELMALQASDWAFMTSRELAGEYPAERTQGHARELEASLAILGGAMGDSRGMRADARLRGLAPHLSLAPLLEPCSAWGRTGIAR